MAGYSFSQLIDFTRTSAATYVDSTGKIVTTPASRNLLTYTQEFDNSTVWGPSGVSVTPNAAISPDGTLTADKLVESNTNALHTLIRTITTTAVPYTWSCYIKAAERTFALLYHVESNSGVSINLLTGATGTPSGVVAPTAFTATSVGNGWYRLSMTATATAASNGFRIYTATSLAGGVYQGDGTSGIYIWGAQLEQASAATTYTRNVGGVYPPRFDYDPVTLAAKGLLVEEQRTNLLLRSQEFDVSPAWNIGTNTVTANVIASPDGSANADLFTATATGIGAFLRQQATLAATTTYTVSTFFKKGTADFANITVFDNTDGNRYWFNLNTGAIASTALVGAGYTNASARIENYGNGWFRCIVTFTTKSSTAFSLFATFTDADASLTVTNGKTGYIYGAQLEAGSFATSYIPTVASQVTRSADQASITGPNFSQWYNPVEGSFVAEYSPLAVDNDIALSVSSAAGYGSSIYLPADSSYQFIVVNSTVQAQIDAGTVTALAINKTAAAYKANDFAASVGGGVVVTDTSGTIPTADRAVIGGLEGNTANRFNGHIRSIRYYPTRLGNSQLQALTA
jgi:hypothetical protein